MNLFVPQSAANAVLITRKLCVQISRPGIGRTYTERKEVTASEDSGTVTRRGHARFGRTTGQRCHVARRARMDIECGIDGR